MSNLLVALSLVALSSAPEVLEGDLVFQESKARQALAISKATQSPIGHVGIVTIIDGEPYVYEAAGPVGLVSLERFTKRGLGGRLWVKRLKDRDRVLTEEALSAMRRVALSFKGRPYDLYFQWDKRRLYCSELVYDIYLLGAGVSLGRVQQVGDLDLSSPEVKRLIGERYRRTLKRALDTSELIITPVSLFEDPRLITVSAPP